ncbi:hypothetical protein [Halomicrobium salinisoli]|uniref:hypothetical protein n=1 Tax=Halomicrobium salinisoli TaxID=2878391 RepID=UPI001CF0A9F7|nr:hypothetical protein [Halomicrobium salinisoli]
MTTIDRFTNPLTRRTALGLAGSAVLAGGLLNRGGADEDVSISVDDDCTSASIELRPPSDETWTAAVEFVDDEGTLVRHPSGGQTVSGGGTANLAVSMDSPGTSVRRAYVVRGSDPDGPVVAEETCGSSDGDGSRATGGDAGAADDDSDSEASGGTSAWAVDVGGDGDSEAVAVAVSEETEGDTIVVTDDS